MYQLSALQQRLTNCCVFLHAFVKVCWPLTAAGGCSGCYCLQASTLLWRTDNCFCCILRPHTHIHTSTCTRTNTQVWLSSARLQSLIICITACLRPLAQQSSQVSTMQTNILAMIIHLWDIEYICLPSLIQLRCCPVPKFIKFGGKLPLIWNTEN